MEKRRTGNRCVVRSCATSADSRIPLFRFPKDPERCRKWAIACDCLEMLEKSSPEELYKSYYRVCRLHFEEKTLNSLNNRLLHDATPSLYLDDGECSSSMSSQEYLTVNRTENIQDIGRSPSMEPAVDVSPTYLTSELMSEKDKSVSMDPLLVSPTTAVTSVQTSLLYSPTTSTQTSRKLSEHSPRKEKLRKKIRALHSTTTYLQRKEMLSKERETSSVSKEVTVEDFKILCDKFLPETTSQFVKVQAEQHGKNPKGRRYSKEFKQTCLTIYFMGPKSYNYLSTLFCLPTKRTLTKITENLDIKPGFNNVVFDALKIKVDSFIPQEKCCIICIDEMSLKAHLYYNITEDEVVGLEDIGIGKEKLLKPALNATTVLLKGIYRDWKQPLTFHFVHTSCPSADLKMILGECIHRCKQIGLDVVGVTSDMGSNNMNLCKQLGVTPERPYFFIKNDQIVYMYDVPHLIKSFRNNFEKYIFVFENNKQTSWHHIVNFYQKDKLLHNRLAHKLTDSHIHPSSAEKMKVRLATQVLSATVAACLYTYVSSNLLPADALHTAEVIDKADKLFDIFNSSTTSQAKNYNRAYKGEDYQVEFLKEMFNFFKTVKVIDQQGKNVTSKIKFLKGFQITISGMLTLWPLLKAKGFDYILTRRLNQDALENFFGSIRQQGGNCFNPTPIQFQRAFKKIFSINFLHTSEENCEKEFSILLADVGNIIKTVVTTNIEIPIETNQLLSLKDCNYKTMDIEMNSIRYICGYLVKKCLEKHSCDICISYSSEYVDLDETTLYCHFKAYETKEPNTFGNLCMPSDNFSKYILQLESNFETNFVNNIISGKIVRKYVDLFSHSEYSHPCPDFPLVYLNNLYARMRLYYTLKFINRNFKVTNEKGEKVHRKTIVWRHD